MPIIVTQTGVSQASQSTTTPVQAILSCTSQDVRQVVGTTALGDVNLLVDYTNRIQQQILRWKRWRFHLSGIQYFITEREQTWYWIGPVGTGPSGVVDTGLNLGDVDKINKNTVMDGSNFVPLQSIEEKPLAVQLSYRDEQSRPGKPAVFRQDPLSPNVFELYPAPDNQNNYTPVPQTPFITNSAGGALPQRNYYFVMTYVDSFGNEGSASDREGWQIIPANMLATVHSPREYFQGTSAGALYSQYNVYGSTISGIWQLQNPSPIAIGTDWTEPPTGLLTTTPTPPQQNNLTIMDGYIIQFRYYKTRPILTGVGDILSVPDIYKDVVCAGVNWLGYQYLQKPEESQAWFSQYREGVQGMIKDENLFPQGNQFVQPDPASFGIGSRAPFIETYDYLR